MKVRSLRSTILLTFIAVSFIGSISLFFIAVRYSRRTVRSITKDDLFVISDRIDDTIGEVIQEKFNYMEYIGNMRLLKDDNISLQEKNAIVAPMASNKEKDLISISFIDKDGNAYIGQNTVANFSKAPILQMAQKEKKTVLFGPTKDSVTNQLSINICSPVFKEDKNVAGYLLARLDCKFLCEISSRIRIGQTGYAI